MKPSFSSTTTLFWQRSEVCVYFMQTIVQLVHLFILHIRAKPKINEKIKSNQLGRFQYPTSLRILFFFQILEERTKWIFETQISLTTNHVFVLTLTHKCYILVDCSQPKGGMMSQERVEYKCSFVFAKSQYDAAEYNLVKYVLHSKMDRK